MSITDIPILVTAPNETQLRADLSLLLAKIPRTDIIKPVALNPFR